MDGQIQKPIKREIEVAKKAPPPPELPRYKFVEPKDVSFFGITNYKATLEEKRYVFGIKRADRRRHMYVVGKSGVGKSKLLELLIRSDIYYGHGVCVIDPHGDLIDSILDAIPEHRIEDTVLVDPSDHDFPVSFNPLSNIKRDDKYLVTQGLIEVMKKQFGANWTPRLEHVFRFVALAMLDYPEATMNGMIKLLTDRNYRQKVVQFIQDDMVKRFWAIEFADWSERFDNEAIIPLVNKLSEFLSNPLLRNIFAQVENKINFELIMNTQKIVLINLSKGKIGEENSNFFGSMFITKIYQAGLARAYLPEKKRTDFYIYVDEFQNFMTNTLANLFSESRKYGVCMTVAHQYLGQLSNEVRTTVLGNTGNIIIFRIGGEDAQTLSAELTPIFQAEDIVNLGVREFYLKMAIDGQTFDPFSGETLPIFEPEFASNREKIRDYTRTHYAIPINKMKNLYEKESQELAEWEDKSKGIENASNAPAKKDEGENKKKEEIKKGEDEPAPIV